MMKRCTKCGEEKPATREFFRVQKDMVGGLKSICRECSKAADRARDSTLKPGEIAYKTCTCCRETKLVNSDNFFKQRQMKYGVRSMCKVCFKAKYTEERKTPEYKILSKDYRLRSKYGITLDDYNRMLAEQGGRCKCCGKHASDVKRIVVDHSHFSGEIRGLICHDCNVVIGMMHEDDDTITAAIEYLDTYQEVKDDSEA